VLLQRLDAIEALTRVDTVFLDKTGTLTEDRPALLETRLLAGASSGEAGQPRALRRAASLAEVSRHPLSQALVSAAAVLGPAADDEPLTAWTSIEERPGEGLLARDAEGREWRLGSRAFVCESAPGVDAAAGTAADQVLFGPTGHAAVAFRFEETLRPDARQAVQDLQACGLRVAMLSGDDPRRARRVAHALGIEEVHASAMPEAKLAAVAAAQAEGRRVAMVGDGINDAPVLARADLSIALSSGAGVTQSNADAVLLGNRLGDLVLARVTALRTMRIVRQNLAWAATYNAVCIPLALAGLLPPWAAGIGMAASSLLVVLNAQRLVLKAA
jgi:Cu2+-exporting ATPase